MPLENFVLRNRAHYMRRPLTFYRRAAFYDLFINHGFELKMHILQLDWRPQSQASCI